MTDMQSEPLSAGVAGCAQSVQVRHVHPRGSTKATLTGWPVHSARPS
jgi:hypothetical protein